MTDLTYLASSDGRPLSKIYRGATKTHPPFLKEVVSREETVAVTDASSLARSLMTASGNGEALMRGRLDRALASESRAGRTLRGRALDWIALDFDGVPSAMPLPAPPLEFPAVEAAAKEALAMAFGELPDCAWVAHASAGMGMSGDQLRLHVFMPLAQAVAAPTAKLWLRWLNLSSEKLRGNMALADMGMALRWPLDVSVADDAKLIFIAPPMFELGARDPFKSARDRWYASPGKGGYDIAGDLAGVSPAWAAENQRLMIAELREKAGLPKRNPKIRVKQFGDEVFEIVDNPDGLDIAVIDDSHPEYVRCNVNSGDSRGYFFRRSDPRFMLNFKGEPIWEIAKGSADFAQTLPAYRPAVGGKRLEPLIVREPREDTLYSGLFDPKPRTFDSAYGLHVIGRQSADDFYRSHGSLGSPENYQDALIVFDPRRGEMPVDASATPWIINRYRASRYRREAARPPAGLPAPSMQDLTAFDRECPRIFLVMLHVFGGQPIELARFLNWLAFIYQTGGKTMTAWLMSDPGGTGKGIMYQYILRPLLGANQVKYKSLANLEEQYNDYLRDAQLVIVDEFSQRQTRAGAQRVVDQLKMYITEPTHTIRAMRSNQVEMPSFTNFIFLSNRPDALRLAETDRRYNIATRQTMSLREKYPDIAEWIPEFRHELYAFAGALEAFMVDAEAARVPLENEAREQIVREGESWLDSFVLAIARGDLEYFAEVPEMSPIDGAAGQGMAVASAQGVVAEFIGDAADGRKSAVNMEGLRTLFHVVTGKRPPYSVKQFRIEMQRRGVSPSQVRRGGGKQLRGIHIGWSDAAHELGVSLVRLAAENAEMDPTLLYTASVPPGA